MLGLAEYGCNTDQESFKSEAARRSKDFDIFTLQHFPRNSCQAQTSPERVDIFAICEVMISKAIFFSFVHFTNEGENDSIPEIMFCFLIE